MGVLGHAQETHIGKLWASFIPHFGLDLSSIQPPNNGVYVSPHPPCRPPNYHHPLSCQEETPSSILSLSDSGCQWGQDRRQVWPAWRPCPALVRRLTGAFVTGPGDALQTGRSQGEQGGRLSEGLLFSFIFGEFGTQELCGIVKALNWKWRLYWTGRNLVSGKNNSSAWTCCQRLWSHKGYHCQGT